MICVFVSFVFFSNNELYTVTYICFAMCLLIMLVTTVFMLVALRTIKKTVMKSVRKGMINTPRLIAHALAFVIWMLSFLIYEIVNYIQGESFYASWLMIAFVGCIAELFLVNLIWHLGSKPRKKPIEFRHDDDDEEPDLTVSEV